MEHIKYASAATRDEQVERLYQDNKLRLNNSSTNLVILIMRELGICTDHARKLTVKQRADMKNTLRARIVEHLESGMTQRATAETLGCSLDRVRAVMKGVSRDKAQEELRVTISSMKPSELADLMVNVKDEILACLMKRRLTTYQHEADYSTPKRETL